MSRKVKVSDVRQGATLFYVRAWPHKGLASSVEEIIVTKRPVMNSTGLFGEYKSFFSDDLGCGWFARPFSLKDAGIIPNPYNFHNTFSSRKAAERYAARMNRKCLTAAERIKFERKLSNDS
ncbi:hypothetical protein D3C80_955380 [compost metagenome]